MAPDQSTERPVTLAAVIGAHGLTGEVRLKLFGEGVESLRRFRAFNAGALTLLPLIPTMILLVNPVKNQLWMLTVPFLAQNQMILKLVRSESISMTEWTAYLAAGFGTGLVLWWLAARRYHDERLAISA